VKCSPRNLVMKHSLAYLIVHKWLVVDVPSYLKFSAKMTFRSIFAHSMSAVIHSKKNLITTN